MRRPPRTVPIALLLAAASVAASGCGGNEVAADEAPGTPPTLTVPYDDNLNNGDASNVADSGSGSDSKSSATGDSSGAATGSPTPQATATATPGTGGGATAPEQDTTQDDATAGGGTAPAASETNPSESFCEQNVGAC